MIGRKKELEQLESLYHSNCFEFLVQSPLYGRTTASMEVQPFDYLDSAEFFPDYSVEEKLTAYGILGRSTALSECIFFKKIHQGEY